LLIDANGEKIGEVTIERARQIAEERGYDLALVSPNARPPVAKLLDYGKWRYEQQKAEAKQKKLIKRQEIHEIRLTMKIGVHDLELKMKKAREFLAGGDKLKLTMIFKGRETAFRNEGQAKLLELAQSLSDISEIETQPVYQFKRLTIVLAPKK
jgi:translation initiation factor IF-3